MSDRFVETLRARHEALEGQIAHELNRPQPDSVRVTTLKRAKLRLKDRIVQTGYQEQFSVA